MRGQAPLTGAGPRRGSRSCPRVGGYLTECLWRDPISGEDNPNPMTHGGYVRRRFQCLGRKAHTHTHTHTHTRTHLELHAAHADALGTWRQTL